GARAAHPGRRARHATRKRLADERPIPLRRNRRGDNRVGDRAPHPALL
ncbi:MAG: hypothetical protein AVDCRST_MAG19-4271, partial [uncultured Thermomicrobiales bacterium]